MSNGISLGEAHESEPGREGSEPTIFDLIANILDELGPNGADIFKDIQLGERDLRTIARDPKYFHALERADKLTEAREALQGQLQRLSEWLEQERAVQDMRELGSVALRVPMQTVRAT